MLIHEEERKRESYRVSSRCSSRLVSADRRLQNENLRRRHNWLPFIVELLKAYAAQGTLVPAVDKVRASAPSPH